jgi:hypothetical protein
MEENKPSTRFIERQNLYFKLSIMMGIISILLTAFAFYYYLKGENSPDLLFYTAMVVFIYHVPHLVYGIIALIFYFTKIKKQLLGVKPLKTILSIIFSPISGFIILIAVILLMLSRCEININL